MLSSQLMLLASRRQGASLPVALPREQLFLNHMHLAIGKNAVIGPWFVAIVLQASGFLGLPVRPFGSIG